MRLLDTDIRTREVLDWSGLHLFHYPMSSCSQKLRIYLAAKGIAWTPHLIDLSANESYGEWFLGVNPRGMVPVLVLDGAVHIDSNDIIAVLEERFPDPVLWPRDRLDEIRSELAAEDALHHDLRTLSFRFVHGRTATTKSPEVMQTYREHSGGEIAGRVDAEKQHEIAFYETLADDGLSDARCRAAAERFRAAFDVFEDRLAGAPYLVGDAPSVVDIAWFVYAYRLDLGGYPLARLHPRVDAWYRGLCAEPVWVAEVAPPAAVREKVDAVRAAQDASGATLAAVAGF